MWIKDAYVQIYALWMRLLINRALFLCQQSEHRNINLPAGLSMPSFVKPNYIQYIHRLCVNKHHGIHSSYSSTFSIYIYLFIIFKNEAFFKQGKFQSKYVFSALKHKLNYFYLRVKFLFA